MSGDGMNPEDFGLGEDFDQAIADAQNAGSAGESQNAAPVSYTHLTLPTKRTV